MVEAFEKILTVPKTINDICGFILSVSVPMLCLLGCIPKIFIHVRGSLTVTSDNAMTFKKAMKLLKENEKKAYKIAIEAVPAGETQRTSSEHCSHKLVASSITSRYMDIYDEMFNNIFSLFSSLRGYSRQRCI